MDTSRGTVRVFYYGTATHADLAPLLDELQHRFLTVATDFHTPVPLPPGEPGRGGGIPITLELAFQAVTAGAVLYAASFLSEMAKDHYKTLRQRIVELRTRAKAPDDLERHFPVMIVVGGLAFYIEMPTTESDLAVALRGAAELASAAPETRLLPEGGGQGWPITWDPSTKSWNDPLKGSPPPTRPITRG